MLVDADERDGREGEGDEVGGAHAASIGIDELEHEWRTCTSCSTPFSVERRAPGRPRQRCYECKPRWNPTPEQAERARASQRAAADRRRARQPLVPGGPFVCGCDRDYLTVPLELAGEPHYCPSPRPRKSAPSS